MVFKKYQRWRYRPYLNWPLPTVVGRGFSRTSNRAVRARLHRDNRQDVYLPVRRLPLFEIEDRRLWNPERIVKPYRDTRGWPARFKIVSKRAEQEAKKKSNWLPTAIGFINPTRVAVCVRRKQRREIMHALGVAGGAVKAPRFNDASKIRC